MAIYGNNEIAASSLVKIQYYDLYHVHVNLRGKYNEKVLKRNESVSGLFSSLTE